MEKALNNYLEAIEKYLKPLPVSERIDIVKEIKSEMLELQRSGKTAEEIIERLGYPKELAKAYLGDLIVRQSSFGLSRVLAICAYYSLAGLSGMIIIPILVICAPAFIFCGVITLIAGVVKLTDALLPLGIPYTQYIVVSGISNPMLIFLFCLITGAVLTMAGYGCWKLLICYIRGMSRVKSNLSL